MEIRTEHKRIRAQLRDAEPKQTNPKQIPKPVYKPFCLRTYVVKDILCDMYIVGPTNTL